MTARLTIMLLALLGTAGAAHGQSRSEFNTGSWIPVPKRAQVPDSRVRDAASRGRIVMGNFARCIVDRKPAAVARALDGPADQASSAMIVSLSTNECLGIGEMKFRQQFLRAALFVELWRRRARAEERGISWKPVLSPVAFTATPLADAALAEHTSLLTFADCLVRRERPAASAFAAAAVDSEQEETAFKALQPHLRGCTPRGTSRSLDIAVLQGALAEVLYRAPAEQLSTQETNR